jgi:hypothetical protein
VSERVSIMSLLFFLLFLLTITVTISTKEVKEDNEVRHIIFFGDSLMRYQYLAYVYRLHYHTHNVPLTLINEKLYPNWQSFFYNTTKIFNGYMLCDCYRHSSMTHLSTSRENRHYTHPSGKLIVSYYSWMGYHPIQGMHMNDTSSVVKSFGKYVTHPDWVYKAPLAFVQHHLSSLFPLPSVIFVNSGHWRHKQVAKNPLPLLQALHEAVTLTRRNKSSDITHSHTSLVNNSMSTSGKCVAWLATTTPNIPWWAGSRDADWNILRGHYCRKSLSDEVIPSASTPSTNVESCVYVPFNFKVNKSSDYFDHMHFSNENIYHARTDSALRACALNDSLLYLGV